MGIKPSFNSFTTNKAINWLLNNENHSFVLTGRILRELSFAIKQLEIEIQDMLPEKAKKLTKITGISTITAAIIHAELKGKKMTKSQLASYCGVAPVECSSGMTTKFRNNKRGNRILNSILYSISIHQSRFDKIGTQYFFKKLSEGKSKRHARKCLSRQISNLIWETLWTT